MKINRSLLVAVTLAALPLTSCFGFPGLGVWGDGNVTESERKVGSFSSVESGGSAEVRVHKGPAARVVVTTDENIQEYFEAVSSGGELRLGFTGGVMIGRITKLVVDVYTPELDGVSVSGSGDLTMVDAYKADSFSATVSGSGSVTGTISSNSTRARISGSGIVRLSGSCDDLDLSVSGSGDFDAPGFSAQSAKVVVSGSGDVLVAVSERLAASISGSGSVVYRGKPTVDSSVSGSGSVKSAGQ